MNDKRDEKLVNNFLKLALDLKDIYGSDWEKFYDVKVNSYLNLEKNSPTFEVPTYNLKEFLTLNIQALVSLKNNTLNIFQKMFNL